MVRKRFLSIFMLISIILLTSCIPSGNVIGTADLTTIESTFLEAGDPVHLEVNGGIVATPKGLRIRLTKMIIQMPTRGLTLYGIKFNDNIPGIIEKNTFLNSKIKGRNVCGYIAGTLSNERDFVAAVIGEKADAIRYFALVADDGGNYFGQAASEKLQIGGRNLCSP